MVPGAPATTLPTSTVSGWRQWRRDSSLGRNLCLKHWKLGSFTLGSAAARCVWKACRVAPPTLSLALPSPIQQSHRKPKPSEEGRPKPFCSSVKLYIGVSFGLNYWTLVTQWVIPPCWDLSLHFSQPGATVCMTIHGYLRKTCWATTFLDWSFLHCLDQKALHNSWYIIFLCPEVTTHYLASIRTQCFHI